MRRPAILLATATLALAGCGGSDDEPLAGKATLALSDFAAGWEESAPADSEDGACEAFSEAADERSAREEANYSGKGSWVLNRVYLFADEPAAEQAFTRFSEVTTLRCFGEFFIRGLEATDEGVEIGRLRDKLLETADVGDERSAGRVTFPLKMNGQTIGFTLDVVFVRVGRGISLVAFVQGLAPPNARLLDALTTISAKRLAQVLA